MLCVLIYVYEAVSNDHILVGIHEAVSSIN